MLDHYIEKKPRHAIYLPNGWHDGIYYNLKRNKKNILRRGKQDNPQTKEGLFIRILA